VLASIFYLNEQVAICRPDRGFHGAVIEASVDEFVGYGVLDQKGSGTGKTSGYTATLWLGTECCCCDLLNHRQVP